MKYETLKQVRFSSRRRFLRTSLLFGLAFFLVLLVDLAYAQQPTAADWAVSGFNERVKEYIKERNKLERQLPKLSDESKPEEIEAHFVRLQGSVKTARTGAKQGDIFSPDVAAHFRRVIRQHLKGQPLREVREKVQEAETKGVPLRVNTPYPETKELVEMPPTLLLKLPTLPKQLQFHFVGHTLLLIDKEARLIVDYMPKALP